MSARPLLETCPVMILAGGLGTRLKPVLADRPKGLAPIGDRPFLELQMSLLRDQGARHFVLCVGHLADQIRDEFGDGSELGVRIDYSVEGETLLGTGGAVGLAGAFFQPRAIVLNGDTYLDEDYERILAHHLEERSREGVAGTLTLSRLEDSGRYGTVVLDPSTRFLTGFREKDESATGSGWLNAGAYVIERELLAWIPRGRPSSIEREIFPRALDDGARIASFISAQAFFDIGTPSDFRRFLDLYTSWSESGRQPHRGRRAG